MEFYPNGSQITKKDTYGSGYGVEGFGLITCYGVPWKCRVLGFKAEGFTFSIFRVSGFRLWHLEERPAMKQAPV